MEVNKRSDVDLKQKLADIALSALVNGGLIKEEDFNGVKVEFGYVFQKTDGQIEALHRLTFDNGAVHAVYKIFNQLRVQMVRISRFTCR